MKTVFGKKIGAVICTIAIVLGTLIGPIPVMAEDTSTSSTAPISLDTYLTGYQLSYQDGNDWVTVSDSSTTISMFAKLQFKVRFGGISAQQLYNNDGTLYLDLPPLLTNPTVSSGAVQDANGNNAGTITAEGQRITLQVDKTYLSDLLTKEGTDFKIQNGSLTFTATPDPEQVRKDYKQNINIGNLDITINFDADSDAKSSDLSLQKSTPVYSSDAEGNGYLAYALTVTAGDAAMPKVTVEDHFTSNASFVDSYVGITSTAENLTSETSASVYEEIISGSSSAAHGSVQLSVDKTTSDPGTMRWTIGDMAANEVRVLHYKVKLSSNYVGNGSADNGAITNTATPYSRGYEHNSASSSFTPHAGAAMTKTAGDVHENSDSTITIPYTITVTTDKNNTWPLKNLKISDYFGDSQTQNADKTTLWNAITPTTDFKDLGFHDFKIIDGSTTTNVSKGTSSSTAPYYALKGTNEYPGFNLYIGDVAPGKTITITVNLTMKPIFSAGQVKIGNRGILFSNDKSTLGNKYLGGEKTQTSFEQQHWDRKIMGSATESSIMQTPDSGDTVYIYNNSNSPWTTSASNSAIEIPAGSYQYQVVVNENAIWDVSSSQFTDTLGNNGQFLHYAGYLKLDYYGDGVSSSVSNRSDSDVAKTLAAKTPTRTVWLNINDMTSFSLSPKNLESKFGKGAFLLTYYAKPITGAFSSVKTNNTFTLSGTIIGTGGTSYILPAMSVKTNVTVTGSTNYSAHKYGWYYDPNDTSNGFANGKLYWIITVDGTKVPAGMQLNDVPGKETNHTTEKSVVGIFFGDTPDEGSSITDTYGIYSELSADPSFEQVAASNYSWSSNKTSGEGTLTFNNDIAIPTGKTMYIILVTYPNSKPSDDARKQTTYINKLQERSNSKLGWNDINSATLYVLGQGTNFKEFGEYGTYNADTKTWSDTKVAPNHAISRILTSYTTNDGTQTLTSGTYVDYILVVNYAGDESGKFKVEDVVPEGMEPVYVRYFWIPNGLRSGTNAPAMPEISSDELGTGNWTDIGLKNTAIDNATYQGSAYAYYDSESRRIVFMADNLQKGTAGQVDTKDLQVQVVMRVTNSDNIMGKDTSYTNTMNVYNSSNNLVTTSKVTTTIKTHTVSKSAGDVSKGSVPFTITVNPMSLNLSPDTDTLTLVDELGYSTDNGVPGSMTVDPSTVTVQDSNGNALDSSRWTLKITKDTANKKTVMTMTVPDGQKLTIKYNASIDASPGTPVTYTNTAHWYGLSKDSYNTVTNKVSYNVDATFGFSNKPVINLIKADQDDVAKTLSGAKFALYKATQADGNWTYNKDHPLEIATTDSNGKLAFGSGTAELQFNTIYAIVETDAPTGYVKNSSPFFIAMAREKNGDYPNESTEWGNTVDDYLKTYTASDLSAWANQGVTVNYRGSTYTYTAYNHKASLNLVKEFQDKDGSTLTTPPDGTFYFGLYSSDNNLVETLTITYSNGTASYQLTENNVTKSVDSATFTDLNVDDSYSVYELDANREKVKTGHILYNKEGNGYIASYTLKKTGDADPVSYDPAANQITVEDTDSAGTVTITNQEFTIPDTGIYIRDNFWYFVAFLLLDSITICYVLYLKRRFNKSHYR